MATDDYLFDRLLGSGTAFGATTERVAADAGSYAQLLLDNRVGSVDLLLFRLQAFSTAQAYVQLIIDPDTDLPTTPLSAYSLRMDEAAKSLVQLFGGFTKQPMSGGTIVKDAFVIPTGGSIEMPWKELDVPSGHSLGIVIPGSPGLEALMNAFWMEL